MERHNGSDAPVGLSGTCIRNWPILCFFPAPSECDVHVSEFSDRLRTRASAVETRSMQIPTRYNQRWQQDLPLDFGGD